MTDDPDTSDIPEATEEWFTKARLMNKFVCTPGRPWDGASMPGLMVLHPSAVAVDEPEVARRCPVCGYEWRL